MSGVDRRSEVLCKQKSSLENYDLLMIRPPQTTKKSKHYEIMLYPIALLSESDVIISDQTVNKILIP